MEIDLTGSSAKENEASSKRIRNDPSVLSRGVPELGVESTKVSNQVNLIDDLDSSTPKTETSTEKGLSECPENESRKSVLASCQERTRSNANCLFSSAEAMVLLQAESFGLDGACRMFLSFDPPVPGHIEACFSLPNTLRRIADELDDILRGEGIN